MTSLQQALREAFQRALEEGRHDLVDNAIDELWLVFRYPGDLYPDGPPAEVLEAVAASKARRAGVRS